jgi:His/Glu/Gln/Arg/opine family amino acid ABC transporter permease subunit
MLKVFKKVLTFAMLFGIIVILIPRSNAEETDNPSTDDPAITEAIENIKFYSSFNYQTLTSDRLNKITADFFLPANYSDVVLTYVIDSEYLELANEKEMISLRTSSGTVDTEVYRVSLIKLPNVIKGDQSFLIYTTFTHGSQSITTETTGTVTPIIPDDFLGGSLYTVVRYGRMFLEGAALTLGISLAGTVAGFILALFLATAKLIEVNPQDKKIIVIIKRFLTKLSSIYITIFRGTPMIVQASFFWYGFGLFGNALLCGLFVVTLNTAAYIAEIIRGAVNAIDKGQTEAGMALGMSYGQTMIFVI